MKKMLTAALAIATLAVAVPAAAYPGDNINQREREIARRIDMGARFGGLTRYEAQRLRSELAGIERLESRYRIGGLNRFERADLDRRLDRLSAQLRFERHDRDRRGRW